MSANRSYSLREARQAVWRWWYEPPRFEQSSAGITGGPLGWRKPHISVTREADEDYKFGVILTQLGYRAVHHDFDRDCNEYVWWPVAPVAALVYTWLNSRHRFCIEHAMRGRIADKPEGETWTSWTWRFRKPSAWTWQRTRA